jgi:hypothetical protein
LKKLPATYAGSCSWIVDAQGNWNATSDAVGAGAVSTNKIDDQAVRLLIAERLLRDPITKPSPWTEFRVPRLVG